MDDIYADKPSCPDSCLPVHLCSCPLHRADELLPNGEATGRPFRAQYAGSCISCSYSFEAGSFIVAAAEGGYAHAKVDQCLAGAPFESKYRGWCVRCGTRYEPGMMIAHAADPARLARRHPRRRPEYMHAGGDQDCRGMPAVPGYGA